ncbi:MAG: type II toxin-antitoxin system RelE/ParE family toxin [Nitrospirota bacterium]|nr:type II toxin-antitoxin system RelE/ParE family toxin [Nitrospirota bacterium]
MIRSFKNKGTEDIFNGINSKDARKTCAQVLWKIATRKLDQLDSIIQLNELRIPPNNRLEALTGDRKGQYSIRINDQYHICFIWIESGSDKVEITDCH